MRVLMKEELKLVSGGQKDDDPKKENQRFFDMSPDINVKPDEGNKGKGDGIGFLVEITNNNNFGGFLDVNRDGRFGKGDVPVQPGVSDFTLIADNIFGNNDGSLSQGEANSFANFAGRNILFNIS